MLLQLQRQLAPLPLNTLTLPPAPPRLVSEETAGRCAACALVGLVSAAALATLLGELLHQHLAAGLLNGGSLVERVAMYSMFTLATIAVMAADWRELGPALAIPRVALSAAVAWLLVVPLGAGSELLLEIVFLAGLFWLGAAAMFCGCCALALHRDLSTDCKCAMLLLVLPFGVAVACACLFLGFNLVVRHVLVHTFGLVVIFLFAYATVREVVSSTVSVSSWPGVQALAPPTDAAGAAAGSADEATPLAAEPPAPPSPRPAPVGGSRPLLSDADEYQLVVATFEEGCRAGASQYDFRLKIGAVYSVGGQRSLARTDEGRHLFHGTKRENAERIIREGFRLPPHKGMFGQGIYFADCPLKSSQYTDMAPWRMGIILVCWVELGRPSPAKAAKSSLTRPPHRTLWQWLRRERRYTSVIGVDKSEGGVLKVPEYVVYDPKLVEVDYILEIRRDDKPR